MADQQKTAKKIDSAKTKVAKAAAAKAAATARKHAREKARAKAEALRPKNQVAGFAEFMRKQGVIGLAIGLVLGVQVKAVVDQIVVSFINPILGLILPGTGSLAEKSFSLTVGEKIADFQYGAFLSVMISFITVAGLVYYGVKALRLDRLEKK